MDTFLLKLLRAANPEVYASQILAKYSFLEFKEGNWLGWKSMVDHLATSMHLKISQVFKQNICQFSTLLSTNLGSDPTFKVKRYDRSHPYDRPAVVGAYNENMRGIDLFDMMCTLYKRWRWYL